MKGQNFQNHTRWVPLFHFLTSGLILLLLIGSVVNLFHSTRSNLYSASLICLISIILVLLAAFIREFPLKAQDRAIRAEENLRHFALTGKLLDKRLSLGQIIALRFASDDEFVELANKAAQEKMAPKEIKRAIRIWRVDYHRA